MANRDWIHVDDELPEDGQYVHVYVSPTASSIESQVCRFEDGRFKHTPTRNFLDVQWWFPTVPNEPPKKKVACFKRSDFCSEVFSSYFESQEEQSAECLYLSNSEWEAFRKWAIGGPSMESLKKMVALWKRERNRCKLCGHIHD